MEFEIEKFSPTKAELARIAEESKTLVLPDPFDSEQYKRVKDAKTNLVHVRNDIAKTGKAMRDGAIAFQKQVIEKEKELVGIIKPSEDRLATLLDEADHIIERRARVEVLPHRRERLAELDSDTFHVEVADYALLDMDGPSFESYFNACASEKNEADARKIAADQKKLDEEKAELARKQELAEAEERGRKQAAERAEQEEKERQSRAQRDKEDAERKEREAKERLEKESRYQHFLSDNGYTESTKDTFHIERDGDDVRLYRLVGILTLK